MIWGLSIQPGDDFTITLDEELCLSLAAIDSRSKFGQSASAQGGSYSQLILKTETCEQLLCTLVQGTIFQQCLKLKLMPGEKVTFTVQGSCCVYVTGYSYSSPEGPANGEETVTEEDTTNDGSRNDCNVEVKLQPENDDCSSDSIVDEETFTNLILAEGKQQARCALLSDEGFVQEEQVEWVPDDSVSHIDKDKDRKIVMNIPSESAGDIQQARNPCTPLSDEGIVHEEQEEWMPDDSGCIIDNSKDRGTTSNNRLESTHGPQEATSTFSIVSGEGIVHEGQEEWLPDDSGCIIDRNKDRETISNSPLKSADFLQEATNTCAPLSGEGIVYEEQDEWVPDDSGCIIDNSMDTETFSENPSELADGLKKATSRCSSLSGEGIVHEGQDESVPDDSSCVMDNSKDRETISDNLLELTDGQKQATSTCAPQSEQGIIHEDQDEWAPDGSACIIDNCKDRETISENASELTDGPEQATSTCTSLSGEGIVHVEEDEQVPDDSGCIIDNSKDRETISDNASELTDGLKRATGTFVPLSGEGIIHEEEGDWVPYDSGCIMDNCKDRETVSENPSEWADGLKQATSTCSSLSGEGIVHEDQGELVPDDSACIIDNSMDRETICDNPLESTVGPQEDEESEINSCPENENHGERSDDVSGMKEETWTESMQQVNEVIDSGILNLQTVTPGEVQESTPHVKKGGHQQLSSASCVFNGCVEGDDAAQQCKGGVASCSNSKGVQKCATGKPFKGKHCKKGVDLEITVAKHKRNHKGKRNFICQDCGAKFCSKANLVDHERVHTGKKPFKCTYCKKKFNQKGNLKVHERIHTGEKPFQCEHCGKTFIQKGNLANHERIHTGEMPFKCHHCGKKFHQKANLVNHDRSHCNKKPFKCKYCSKQFHSRANFAVHEVTHTIEKPFQCGYCEMSFISERNLKNHERSHILAQPFNCKLCGETFDSRNFLADHERTHSGKKNFRCKYCRKRFRFRSNCTVHERIHTRNQLFNCEQCKHFFVSEQMLANHMKLHTGEKSLSCKHCGKKFGHKSNLIYHEMIHSGEKPYSCKHCGKQFRSRSNCTAHERIHSAGNYLNCKFCGKNFCRRDSLVYHERIHSGEKPFKCKYCRKQFRSRSNCQAHEKIHSDGKRLKCKFCGKMFRGSNTLVYHERIHSGEKPFNCKYCRKKFRSKSHCTRHERIHSREKPFNCKLILEEPYHSSANPRDHQKIYGSKTTINKDKYGQKFHKGLPKVDFQRIPAEGSFKGSFCAKEFDVKRDLEDHERVHGRGKSFLCQYCGKQLSSLASLIIHERIHTGEKPFQCDHCEKSFAHKGNLTAHERVHTAKKHL